MLGRSKGQTVIYGRGLRTLSIVTVIAMLVDLGLIFFWVPLEAEQGFLQKIFYVHVPLAIISLATFIVGGVFAVLYLRTRDRRWDMRSYVTIHIALIYSVGTLISGSIWAKGSWGHWWVWGEPELTAFLIVFLLYCCYQPLRFSIEDPERQSIYASVFAILGGVFVPLCFVAVRLSTVKLHPQVFDSTSNLPWQMALMFLISLATFALLFATLCKYELTAKHARAQLRTLRERLAGDDGPAPSRARRSAAPLGGALSEPRAYSTTTSPAASPATTSPAARPATTSPAARPATTSPAARPATTSPAATSRRPGI